MAPAHVQHWSHSDWFVEVTAGHRDVSSLKWLQLHVSHTLEQKLHPSVGTGPSWEHEEENPDPSRCSQATILPFQLEGNSFQLKTFP